MAKGSDSELFCIEDRVIIFIFSEFCSCVNFSLPWMLAFDDSKEIFSNVKEYILEALE